MILAALALSRSAQRRSGSSTPTRSQSALTGNSGGTARDPIAIPSSDGNNGDGQADDDESNGRSDTHQVASSTGGASPDSSNSSESGSGDNQHAFVPGDDSVGSPGSDTSPMPESDYAALGATEISRDQWIPVHHRPRRFAFQADCDPWPLRDVRPLSVRHLTTESLYAMWSRPKFWLFPRNPRPRTETHGTLSSLQKQTFACYTRRSPGVFWASKSDQDRSS
ncbi:unnamed protein product [Phytophthora fragariaefolia]|uniref:Unnamed protein product n=1 Tax=Phytophthora fragariaefolia TaxID=1490495 RepID=A0A9W6TSZ1_9STRA|nr:unnamed protein product [Phytophthora fragariaefolia]